MPSPGEIAWLGHATALLDAGGVRVITDPVLRDRVAHLRRHAASPGLDVPAVDAVLLSHLHRDHADAPSLRRVAAAGVPVLVPRGAGTTVSRILHGTPSEVIELAPGDTVPLGAGGAVVRAVPAVHDGRRSPVARGVVPDAVGYVLEPAAGPSIYFAGDTELYDGLAEEVGPVDAALLPIWGWGPSLGTGHMDPHDAARATALLRPGLAVPIHWGTFLPLNARRGHRALTEPAQAFARYAAELAPGVRVRVVEPGGLPINVAAAAAED